MKSFLSSKGIRVTDIELLTKYYIDEAKSFTYRIAIKPEDFDKALKADVWPHRVAVRLFRQKRQQPEQNWSLPTSGKRGSSIDHNRRSRNPGTNIDIAQSDTDGFHLETQNRFDAQGFEPEVFN